MILLQIANQNLLLGFMPESVGLFIFGVGLIVLTIGLRWILKQNEEGVEDQIGELVKRAK